MAVRVNGGAATKWARLPALTPIFCATDLRAALFADAEAGMLSIIRGYFVRLLRGNEGCA